MTSSSPDSRVHNLEFSVGGLVREVKPSASKEATVCWMVNVVRQEGKGEAMTVLARRCMDRFLASLEEEDSLEAWSCSPLLAASCLLVTSKIFSPNPISALSLLKYADNAFVMQELLVSCTSSRCTSGTKLEIGWQGLFPTQLWERGPMWTVSGLCEGRRGGTIKEKVEEGVRVRKRRLECRPRELLGLCYLLLAWTDK